MLWTMQLRRFASFFWHFMFGPGSRALSKIRSSHVRPPFPLRLWREVNRKEEEENFFFLVEWHDQLSVLHPLFPLSLPLPPTYTVVSMFDHSILWHLLWSCRLLLAVIKKNPGRLSQRMVDVSSRPFSLTLFLSFELAVSWHRQRAQGGRNSSSLYSQSANRLRKSKCKVKRSPTTSRSFDAWRGLFLNT